MKRLDPTPENMALMIDTFCAGIEHGIWPVPNSEVHHMARWLVADSGFQFRRKRTRLKHRRPRIMVDGSGLPR